jgi:hypothetical protein
MYHDSNNFIDSTFNKNCYFGHGKYGTYFPIMNKYSQSLNLLLDNQILFLYHPNLWQELKETDS